MQMRMGVTVAMVHVFVFPDEDGVVLAGVVLLLVVPEGRQGGRVAVLRRRIWLPPFPASFASLIFGISKH
jgi:hypothetical protein